MSKKRQKKLQKIFLKYPIPNGNDAKFMPPPPIFRAARLEKKIFTM
jgi:hypothetical protein